MLAGISVDYLIRLEQGRGSCPSAQVLGALARALQLTVDERDRLYRLAGFEPPARDRIDNLVRRSTMRLLHRLTDLPALVTDARGDLLAWNDLALALIGDLTALPHRQRNLYRLAFSRQEGVPRRVVYDTPEQRHQAAAELVGDLRATAAKYPNDTDLSELVDDLRHQSATFARLWNEGRVDRRRASVKTFDHPAVGRLTLDCDVAILPDSDQRFIIYSAEPGTSDWSTLEVLRVIGVERLAPSTEMAHE